MEDIKNIKCKLVERVTEVIENGLDHVCTHELGQVVDMIKDLEKVLYYEKIIKAMDEHPERAKDYITPMISER